MPLFISENDVQRLITMSDAIGALESAFSALSSGDGTATQSRQRFFLPHGVMHHMAAALPGKGYMGTKTYTSFGREVRFYVLLFSSESGELLALIEGNKLGQVRTGAATGVAARYLARKDSHFAALLGSGYQAQAQAEAILLACPNLREVFVYSRDFVRRERFCQQMTRRANVRFTPRTSAEEAVRGTQVVLCATTATDPILMADWLTEGHFVAAVGANRLTAREIEEQVVGRADIVVVDDMAQARAEAAELIFAYEKRLFSWDQAYPLSAIAARREKGRTDLDQITLFKSLGIALEDIAVAALVYEKAKAEGSGTDF
ncbi:MAG: ornithine cyclodeaminase family protein [Capsulimonadales bacterium]|nr:ornithine cyclodeaminase family protein [Capsulimonadales bacterium]